MQNRLGWYALLLFFTVMPLLWADVAEAIPAFARQHKAECTTCHTIYPELNEFGEAFQKNSYVWPGSQGVAEREARATAAGKESELPAKGKGKEEALWLAGVPEVLPVSFTGVLNYAYDEHARDTDKFDFSTRALVLHAGGAFRDRAGFFGTFNLYTEGKYDPLSSTVPANESSSNVVNELFLSWRHALDTPFNVKIGRFEPRLSLWKKNNRVTVSSSAPTTYRVGKSPFSINSPEDAVEVNAVLAKRIFVAAGVVDRNGQNSKDVYGHVSTRIGGADFLGNEPEVDLERDNIWDYLSVTVGAYGYSGRNADTVNGIAANFNSFYRAGGDIDILFKRLRVRLSGVTGKDNNPEFLAVGSELRSLVLSGQGEYLFGSNTIGTFRYEYQDDGSGISRRYIPAVVYAPLENVDLTLEYRYETVAPYGTVASAINRTALLGVKFAF